MSDYSYDNLVGNTLTVKDEFVLIFIIIVIIW